ncbi:MAG: putative DNA binding domain-containing protein [Bacteroidales bacterium]|nr:putative DNA binding domain-containing protein [Bacteroidales bacterium]
MDQTSEITGIISGTKIFCDCSTEELNTVTGFITTRKINKDELVFSRLDRERILYVVIKGRLELIIHDSTQREFEKGDVFGEIGVINQNYRTGTIKAIEDSELLCLDGNILFDKTKVPSETALKIVLQLAIQITSYLSSDKTTSTTYLISRGENNTVEFKSTLRYNLFTKKFDRNIENASLKTIAGFLNSQGGTLFIGVDDNQEVLGLESDQFKNNDRMLLHFTKITSERIGENFLQYINAEIEKIGGKKLLRIDVRPSEIPAYMKTGNNDDVFYIRTGPSTTQLNTSNIFDYIISRFDTHEIIRNK